MRKIFLAMLFASTAIGAVHIADARADIFSSFGGKAASQQHPGSFADLAEKLLPAVVNISSTQKAQEQDPLAEMPQFPPGSPFQDFFQEFMNRPDMQDSPFSLEPPASLGSGFIIDAKNGYIITNNHVISGADDVRITFHDDEIVQAEVIGRDEKTDLAVLKVDTDKKLTEVKFGDSDKMRVGDWVLAIGNPFGLGGTVTAGIISARQRDIQSGPYDDYIQTDASINRGNSGGPMFDLEGNVIGINTAIFSPSGGSVGIGFAIPSSLAKSVIDQIIEFGRTRRGWLGVKIQTVTEDIAESLGLGDVQGALVAEITPGGPAEKAGLRAGDIILEFNNHAVDEMRNLPRMVAETSIGTSANVTYWRDGRRNKITVEIGELEKAEESGLIENEETQEAEDKSSGTSIEGTGLTLSALSETLKEKFGVTVDEGVLITGVEPDSDAARKGMVEGDVIIEVNQQPVGGPEQFGEVIKKAQSEGRGSVLLLLNQNGEVRFTALKLSDSEKKSKDKDADKKEDKKPEAPKAE